MSSHEIDYPELVDDALRTVARRVLQQVAEEGLPGEHHFYICLHTDHPELEMPSPLRDSHAEEMTIVLQNQFWDLIVDEEAFEVSLRFGGEPTRLRVPWRAIKSFVDPAAEFGLRFEAYKSDQEQLAVEESDSAQESPGKIVSLKEFKERED